MKNFKEWLSDYLRYFMLLLAGVLIFALAMIGVRIYRNQRGGQPIEILSSGTEALQGESESRSEQESEAAVLPSETETETSSEAETQRESRTAAQTGAGGGQTDGNPESSSAADRQDMPERMTEAPSADRPGTGAATPAGNIQTGNTQTGNNAQAGNAPAGNTQETLPAGVPEPAELAGTGTSGPGQASPAGQTAGTGRTPGTENMPVTEKATEKVTETEPAPVYMTLTGSCYIRSGPGYEYDIIGEYMYGTTVQVLDDSSGWYKVQVDGMTGYMGARFFH